MATDPARTSPAAAALGEIVLRGGSDPTLQVSALGDLPGLDALRAPLGGRLEVADADRPGPWLADLAARATPERPVLALADPSGLFGTGLGALRDLVAMPARNVKILGLRGSAGPAPRVPMAVGVARSLPHLDVLVPSDGVSAVAALRAVLARTGPAYLELDDAPGPQLTAGALDVGIAAELRAGTDLTVAAVGPVLGLALEVAEELARVGVQTRVLDLASVKPFDAPAILRAARETRALLVLEEGTAPTGVGTLVAAVVAENAPVLVRRLGTPDLPDAPGTPADRRATAGISRERALEEAWELLRAKGKVD